MRAQPIICVKCERDMEKARSGVYVKEMYLKNTAVYKIWSADEFVCPDCGLMVVGHFADKPLAEHFQKDEMELYLRVCKKAESEDAVYVVKEWVRGEND